MANRFGRASHLLILLPLAIFASCHKEEPASPVIHEVTDQRTLMGTVVEITALGEDRATVEAAVEAGFGEIKRLEALLSSWREDSDLSKLNRTAGQGMIETDPEIYLLVERSLEISRLSNGAFDITVAALKGLWSFDPERPRTASPGEIAERLPLIGWEGVGLDPARRAVSLARPGMRIDLGGIAKGYAAERAILVMKKLGVTMAMVSTGGDLMVMGPHGDRPWRLGIQDPRDPERLAAWIEGEDLAVATSGDYERFFIQGGQRRSHLLDPKTGAPAAGCRSVTIVAREGWLADALATAVFVMGPEPGMKLVESREGVEAVVIAADGTRYESSGLAGKVHWESDSP